LQSPLDDSLANMEEDESSGVATYDIPTENDIVDLLEHLIEGSYVTNKIRQYILIALIKLTNKLNSGCANRCVDIINKYKTNINLEIQQRPVEFSSLNTMSEDIRSVVLDRMPALEKSKESKKQNMVSEMSLLSSEEQIESSNKNSNDLLDMIFDEATTTSNKPKPMEKASSSSSNDIMDLLGDIQMGTSTMPPLTPSNNNSSNNLINQMNNLNLMNTSTPANNNNQNNNLNSLLSLGNVMQPTTPITPMIPSNPMTPITSNPMTPISASPMPSVSKKEENILYHKNGLKIIFNASKENPVVVALKTRYIADPSYVID